MREQELGRTGATPGKDPAPGADRKFQPLFEKGQVGVSFNEMIYDEAGKPLDYRVLDANQRFLELTGIDPRQKKITEVFPGIEKDSFDWIGTFGRVAQGGGSIRFEQYFAVNSRWYDCVAYQNQPDHFVLTFLDISERKLTAQQLAASNESNQSLIRSMQDGFSVLDSRGVALDANPSFCRMTGFTREELVGVGAPHPYWPPEEYPRIQAALQETLSSEVTNFELIFMRKNGERFPVIVSPFAVRNAEGEIISYSATVKDISERKRAETALRDAHDKLEVRVNERTAALQEANAELHRLLADLALTTELLESTGRMAKVGGWELDLRTSVVSFSKETARIHEVDFPYVPPKLSQGSQFYAPETWPIVMAAVQAAVEHGKAYDLELPFITAKGRHIWVRVQGFAVMEHGKATKLHGTFQDITDRKQAEESLREANTELQRLLATLAVAEERERRRIGDGLHDDVSQRLFAAKLALFGMEGANTPEAVLDFRAVAERQIDLVMERLRSLTFELVSPELKRLGLAASLDSLCQQCEQQSGIAITFESDAFPKPAGAEVDILFAQAARELLHNAVRHARAKNIRVELRLAETGMEMIVEDDGIGIDSANLTKGFSPSGGYGLFNIRERTKHLRGDVQITAASPGGTRIVIRIPPAPESATPEG